MKTDPSQIDQLAKASELAVTKLKAAIRAEKPPEEIAALSKAAEEAREAWEVAKAVATLAKAEVGATPPAVAVVVPPNFTERTLAQLATVSGYDTKQHAEAFKKNDRYAGEFQVASEILDRSRKERAVREVQKQVAAARRSLSGEAEIEAASIDQIREAVKAEHKAFKAARKQVTAEAAAIGRPIIADFQKHATLHLDGMEQQERELAELLDVPFTPSATIGHLRAAVASLSRRVPSEEQVFAQDPKTFLSFLK